MATANFLPVIRASEAGIKINPRGLLATVPSVASYVGGDIVSGILACGIDKSKDLSLLIDGGTNGEIVLGNKAMRPVVSNGIIAVKARADLIEITSASLPVRGVIIPPVPKAKPIIRLEAIALPFGANSCAIVTPKGRVARMRNPVKKEQK